MRHGEGVALAVEALEEETELLEPSDAPCLGNASGKRERGVGHDRQKENRERQHGEDRKTHHALVLVRIPTLDGAVGERVSEETRLSL